ncbi:MAG: DUF2264 domain-containing protein [Dysgonamonadaceae bacterium]|jgi:hypothetical protein|nr:DUF2264 domain-containing protein [Dysgonamonadaceae bacterium]
MNTTKIIVLLYVVLFTGNTIDAQITSEQTDREYWLQKMLTMVDPVIRNLSENTLRENIPIGKSSVAIAGSREFITHMESVGRTFAGLAPWLELGTDTTREGMLREKYIALCCKALSNSVDPSSPDYFNSTATRQILVNSAFLIQGLFRAPKQLWDNLDTLTKQRLVEQWKSTRTMVPGNNNWLLFSAMIECGLKEFGGEWDFKIVKKAVDSHWEWYKGDGIYGDGDEFHFDYYNSYVIHPMLKQVLEIARKYEPEYETFYKSELIRFTRYAGIQERMIAPDGTYPVIGRSITYRLGAFQVLAQAAQEKILPSSVSEGQVRAALTAIIRKQLEFPGTYDKNGWLTIGLCGEQTELGDAYLSTPCLYLCSLVFLPLGLRADDAFWTSPAEEWTSVKAFSGKPVSLDKFLKE